MCGNDSADASANPMPFYERLSPTSTLLACIAHVGLPAQLAPAVRAEVEIPKACACLLNLAGQCALGRCLCGP